MMTKTFKCCCGSVETYYCDCGICNRCAIIGMCERCEKFSEEQETVEFYYDLAIQIFLTIHGQRKTPAVEIHRKSLILLLNRVYKRDFCAVAQKCGM